MMSDCFSFNNKQVAQNATALDKKILNIVSLQWTWLFLVFFIIFIFWRLQSENYWYNSLYVSIINMKLQVLKSP